MRAPLSFQYCWAKRLSDKPTCGQNHEATGQKEGVVCAAIAPAVFAG